MIIICSKKHGEGFTTSSAEDSTDSTETYVGSGLGVIGPCFVESSSTWFLFPFVGRIRTGSHQADVWTVASEWPSEFDPQKGRLPASKGNVEGPCLERRSEEWWLWWLWGNFVVSQSYMFLVDSFDFTGLLCRGRSNWVVQLPHLEWKDKSSTCSKKSQLNLRRVVTCCEKSKQRTLTIKCNLVKDRFTRIFRDRWNHFQMSYHRPISPSF